MNDDNKDIKHYLIGITTLLIIVAALIIIPIIHLLLGDK